MGIDLREDNLCQRDTVTRQKSFSHNSTVTPIIHTLSMPPYYETLKIYLSTSAVKFLQVIKGNLVLTGHYFIMHQTNCLSAKIPQRLANITLFPWRYHCIGSIHCKVNYLIGKSPAPCFLAVIYNLCQLCLYHRRNERNQRQLRSTITRRLGVNLWYVFNSGLAICKLIKSYPSFWRATWMLCAFALDYSKLYFDGPVN